MEYPFKLITFFLKIVLLSHWGWSAMVGSQLTATLHLLVSSSPLTSAYKISGTIGTYHHAQLTFVFLVETGFHYVGQAGHELLALGDLPSLASQRAGITGMSHLTWSYIF